MMFQTNAVIQFRNAHSVTRLIVAVRDTGYSWRHLDEVTVYDTEGTTDPLLEDGWKFIYENN